MKSNLLTILCVCGLFGLAGCSGTNDEDGQDGASGSPVVGTTVTDSGQGSVTVKATITALSGGQATINITLDTHSVDLTNYDPSKNSQLEDSAGTRHEPKAGSRVTVPGSHHKEADVMFDAPVGRWVLIVKDLAGVPERRLVFEA